MIKLILYKRKLLFAQEDEMAKLLMKDDEMAVPGIGYYSALLIVSEVGDINRLLILIISMALV